MDLRTAKELLHIKAWLSLAEEIAGHGREAYLAGPLLQEAGESLMMKIGEASNRLARDVFRAPDDIEWVHAVSNRNWLIHQYDSVNRARTWHTISVALVSWQAALAPDFALAEQLLGLDSISDDPV